MPPGQGNIAGQVTNPMGAVIAGVVVAVRNTQTGIVRKTTTSAAGFYSFSALEDGRYELRI
jgi:hypothetical protein